MAFVPSFKSRLFVGPLAYSQYTKGFSYTDDAMMLDTTTLVDTSYQFIPGQDSATFTIDALLDGSGAATSQFVMANTWKGTPQVVTLCPSGTTLGSETWTLLGNQSNATVTSAVADVVGVNMSVTCDGPTDNGVVIGTDGTAITADVNGTAVDNGAATSNGGVGNLHVTAFSGFTSNSVIIEHSTDNVSFATLGTFTLTTGVTSERLVISAGTTVNRYVRVRDDVTGTGSTTRLVSFARR